MKRAVRIAAWNVNSLRVRLSQVLDWLAAVQPDVLALQETKLPDADFPIQAIQQAGYEVVFSGQRTYNGMAILSKNAGRDIVTDLPGLEDPQRRVLGISFGDIRILNVYVPNGESVTSEKYQYKLNWLQKLDSYLQKELQQYPNMLVLGDFNIAPHDIDVHDPEQWHGQILFSEPERAAFHSILALGFVDCFRQQCPAEKAYSWWDYRMNSFKRNRGLRIDHILASKALASRCTLCYIDKATRALERPSDHAPVTAEFELI